MNYYSAIDLHSNNSYLVILDENDRIVLDKRLPNDLDRILLALAPYKEHIQGIAVESTYNWYWLVDGLMEAGYQLHLVNTTAVKTYSGLKRADDKDDARWLAHLLRLGILPTGFIYPKEARPLRDRLRKRLQLVQQRTRNILSLKSFYARQLGQSIPTNDIYRNVADFQLDDPQLNAIIRPNIELFVLLSNQIDLIERSLHQQVFKGKEDFNLVRSIPGIGLVLGMTVLLEIGSITRFDSAGNFASYARCVESKLISNNKKKGKNNRKCGNRYLSWAFHEAAHHSLAHYPQIKAFYTRKKRKTNGMIAIRAVAHKLARACYHILNKREPFNMDLAFQ
ncbi:IS110 family transposase [Lacimicrobium alkaliphilum]|uniref:IS110 family transposase n=3 Tax=Lacimicrobium alkaliphilum TaxID=1526571 RepID=A0ABQ1QX18_9ALTE|nr:IS110 family transposase [Lacimicrobium alkaliphilum]GGD48083.1 IS110 family transposase [Lacimicrobium alkaliphilum]